MTRITDQVLILEAIADVRKELSEDMTNIEINDVMTRLTTLYSLLDVKMIVQTVGQTDTINHNERKAA